LHHLLSFLDAVFGSTESSRAIVAIISLVRTEFQNSVTGNKGEKVGVKDLLWGGGGFAILQRSGRRKTDREIRDRGGEESIWDVVILDNGTRGDVIGTSKVEYAESIRDAHEGRPESFISAIGDTEPIQVVQRNDDSIPTMPQIALPIEGRRDWSDGEIRQYVMDQLPPGTHFAVRTEAVTAKTITVDVFDPDSSDIPAPPGTMMIEEQFHHQNTDLGERNKCRELERIPRHTVVFQTTWNITRNADLRHEAELALGLETARNEGLDDAYGDFLETPAKDSSMTDV